MAKIKNVAEYMKNKMPKITYKDGNLEANIGEPIIDEN